PLKLASYVGLAVAFVAFLFGSFIIYKTLIYGEHVAGYPSLMVTLLFLGSVQLIALGVIGEYLGRVFDETKRRPLYLINGRVPAGDSGNPRDPSVNKSAIQSDPELMAACRSLRN